jgi:hypothetical protein
LPVLGPDNTLTHTLGVLIRLNRGDMVPHFSGFPCAYFGGMIAMVCMNARKIFL